MFGSKISVFSICPDGEMVDTQDLKSCERKFVRVQVPLGVQNKKSVEAKALNAFFLRQPLEKAKIRSIFASMIKQEKERIIIQTGVLNRLENLGFKVTPKLEWGENAFLLNNEILIDFEYAYLNNRREYVFKLNKNRYEFLYHNHRHFFQLLICESTERVFIVPLSLVMEIFHDIYAAGNDFKEFKPVVKLRNGLWFMRFMGAYDVTDYLNRYDFLISESKTYQAQPTRYNSIIEIKTLEEKLVQYQEAGDLRADSLHSATVEMLRKIGEWSGFDVITEGVLLGLPDFPYQIDCLWYKNGDLYLAIEVCHRGVVEKDKDSLKLAKQHGARKVVIVSEINKIERIRKLFMFDGDLKSWTEVWSFERVFSLYDSGFKFFKDFEKFKRYGWNDSLSEFI